MGGTFRMGGMDGFRVEIGWGWRENGVMSVTTQEAGEGGVSGVGQLTVERVLGDEALRHREFPVTGESVFLGHAGVCPLPRRVVDAMGRHLEMAARGDQEVAMLAATLGRARGRVAELIGSEPSEVALVGPTSLALGMVAAGLRVRKGDNVLVYFDDYPSNVYPWMALSERGVEVRFLNVKRLGLVRALDVLGQVDERTRLVSLSSCHFLAGWRIDVDEIGRGLRSRGILFCLDAIQTLGAFPTRVDHVDILAADAHKWMLGPCASGVLYVRREVQRQIDPVVLGWHNVACPEFVAQEEMVVKPDARRYEAGTHNLAGIVGMDAGLELLMEVGVEAIGMELSRKRAWLMSALAAKGYTVLHADAPVARGGGMVSFFRPGLEMAGEHARLEAGGVRASLRSDRAGQRYLRFAPHFYTTDAELDRAVQLLS